MEISRGVRIAGMVRKGASRMVVASGEERETGRRMWRAGKMADEDDGQEWGVGMEWNSAHRIKARGERERQAWGRRWHREMRTWKTVPWTLSSHASPRHRLSPPGLAVSSHTLYSNYVNTTQDSEYPDAWKKGRRLLCEVDGSNTGHVRVYIQRSSSVLKIESTL